MTNSGTDGLLVSVEPRGEAIVLAVTGEIDILTAPKFQEALDHVLQGKPSSLVVDLSGITFLASAGLGVIAAVGHGIAAATSLKVVADGPVTARPIQLTGLNEVLAVYPTLEEALSDT